MVIFIFLNNTWGMNSPNLWSIVQGGTRDLCLRGQNL
jgi:hypothetical protein